MSDLPADPPRDPLFGRTVRRIREWGGPELYRVTVLFVFGLCVGSAYAMTEPGYRLGERLLNKIRSIPAAELAESSPPAAPDPPPSGTPVDEPAPEPPGSPYFGMWKLIFLHNLKVALVAAIGGMLTRVIPFGVSLLNGTMLGLCCVVIVVGDGLSLLQLILFLGPHGSFELPAILLACAIGSRLTRLARSEPKPGARWRALRDSWKELIGVTVLLLIAASIEARSF